MNTRNRLILTLIAVPAEVPALASGFAICENSAVLVHSSRREVQFGFNQLEIRSDMQFSPTPVYDNTPVPAACLRPSIPDADRTGYSLGYGSLSNRWGTEIYVRDLQFADVTATGVPSDAVYPGIYSSSIVLAGVTAKSRF